ncbi:MAG: HEAT repeat domain-containing protein [Planctomycetaceae bacterium]
MRRIAGLLLLLGGGIAADPAALLKSKAVEERLKGVQELLDQGGANAEALLLHALEDSDWEVVERAALALAVRGTPATKGPKGTAAATERLVLLALEGPIRRIRRAAVEALAKLDPEEARTRLVKRLNAKKDQLRAAEALALLPAPEAAKVLEKMVASREEEARWPGLEALGALKDSGRIPLYTKYLNDPDIVIRAEAARALALTGADAAIPPLLQSLRTDPCTDVMDRRLGAAIRDLLLAQKEATGAGRLGMTVVEALRAEEKAGPASRLARLLGLLGREAAPLGPVADYVAVLKTSALGHKDPQVRAAAAWALGRIGHEDGYEPVARAAASDGDARVRFHALRAAVALKGAEAGEVLRRALREDDAVPVREEAAVLCARAKIAAAVDDLAAALQDKAWEVVVASAVSLGKLHDPKGVAPLRALVKHKDWRLRGGAVVGLGWIRQADAVDILIDAMDDPDLSVRRTAIEFLRYVRGRAVDPEVKEWLRWWEKAKPSYEFVDRKEVAQREKRHGYAVRDKDVYEDMDLVVLQTRGGGDEIQNLLTKLEIKHRMTRQSAVDQAALHPHALFVANCPGEIVSKDVERLDWFVRAGGYLFSSCWALSHTLLKAYPDLPIAKLTTRQQVIDSVVAESQPTEGPFLDGVFDGLARPLYELEGAHLIEVRDKERFEILIDSAECATRWGEGNLAGWCTLGHGVLLDSANHFEAQGMTPDSQALMRRRPKTEEDRMAFAVDHLGYGYEDLRGLRMRAVFQSAADAAAETRDYSIFRFITNFVRVKRQADTE